MACRWGGNPTGRWLQTACQNVIRWFKGDMKCIATPRVGKKTTYSSKRGEFWKPGKWGVHTANILISMNHSPAKNPMRREQRKSHLVHYIGSVSISFLKCVCDCVCVGKCVWWLGERGYWYFERSHNRTYHWPGFSLSAFLVTMSEGWANLDAADMKELCLRRAASVLGLAMAGLLLLSNDWITLYAPGGGASWNTKGGGASLVKWGWWTEWYLILVYCRTGFLYFVSWIYYKQWSQTESSSHDPSSSILLSAEPGDFPMFEIRSKSIKAKSIIMLCQNEIRDDNQNKDDLFCLRGRAKVRKAGRQVRRLWSET